MVWNRTKLEQVAGQRLAGRAKLAPMERAALAFARWQGLTDEVDIDTDAAKRALDDALAELDDQGPDAWAGLAQLATDLGDPAIIGLMQHSLRRSVEQVKALAQTADATNDDDVADPATTQNRRRRRDKDR